MTEFASLADWVEREAIPFSLDSPSSCDAAIVQLIAALGDSVQLLGLGEPMHGCETHLRFRNQFFQRLVQAHGFSAIAIESSFPRGRIVNDYINGCGAASFDEIQETGFSHGFGRTTANCELIDWMRAYNAEPANRVKLQFYGFDSPTEMMNSDSPRHLLYFALDYLTSLDPPRGTERKQRIDALLGEDAAWENPAAMMDPTKAIGQTSAAAALRIETEDLITELHRRRPELCARSGGGKYRDALHYAKFARLFLNYHAALAQTSPDKRLVDGLGIRDLMMAENLQFITEREVGRGKVLAFAHNKHLQLGKAEWQLGPHSLVWWPAGAQLSESIGPSYAAIGLAVGQSESHGISAPEPGTLESKLLTEQGTAKFIPTHRSEGLPTAEIAALPTRTGSTKNPTYFPLTPQSLAEFDYLAMLN